MLNNIFPEHVKRALHEFHGLFPSLGAASVLRSWIGLGPYFDPRTAAEPERLLRPPAELWKPLVEGQSLTRSIPGAGAGLAVCLSALTSVSERRLQSRNGQQNALCTCSEAFFPTARVPWDSALGAGKVRRRRGGSSRPPPTPPSCGSVSKALPGGDRRKGSNGALSGRGGGTRGPARGNAPSGGEAGEGFCWSKATGSGVWPGSGPNPGQVRSGGSPAEINGTHRTPRAQPKGPRPAPLRSRRRGSRGGARSLGRSGAQRLSRSGGRAPGCRRRRGVRGSPLRHGRGSERRRRQEPGRLGPLDVPCGSRRASQPRPGAPGGEGPASQAGAFRARARGGQDRAPPRSRSRVGPRSRPAPRLSAASATRSAPRARAGSASLAGLACSAPRPLAAARLAGRGGGAPGPAPLGAAERSSGQPVARTPARAPPTRRAAASPRPAVGAARWLGACTAAEGGTRRSGSRATATAKAPRARRRDLRPPAGANSRWQSERARRAQEQPGRPGCRPVDPPPAGSGWPGAEGSKQKPGAQQGPPSASENASLAEAQFSGVPTSGGGSVVIRGDEREAGQAAGAPARLSGCFGPLPPPSSPPAAGPEPAFCGPDCAGQCGFQIPGFMGGLKLILHNRAPHKRHQALSVVTAGGLMEHFHFINHGRAGQVFPKGGSPPKCGT